MKSKKVLLVDDNAMVLQLTEVMLQTLTHQVTAFSCAEKALEHYQSNSAGFDLIITDQSMPKMTGVQLATMMLELNNEVPIIIYTGHSKHEIEDQIKSDSCIVLEKPFNLDQLQEAIDSL
ncbi:MAG: hypothetical protein CSA81_05355 [Acidobacteria bacterium]|nr:MAG: hypothetical protein CSA81_05355 [Acidobacteriota bacterium]PIE90985.1 MAG: hypothetical protein CR997_03755 [Acidobacteriota bacterium]